MKGLIIKPKWADMILSGEKTWEIRGSWTNRRGTIGIIKSGSGHIYGTVDLVDCQLCTLNDFENNVDKHRIEDRSFYWHYNQSWTWVLDHPIIYPEPISYKHPQGAVIWVNLGEDGTTYEIGG